MEDLKNISDKIIELIGVFTTENAKFMENGNSSAGRRARIAIGEIKNLCTPYRQASVEFDKTKKTDKVTKKPASKPAKAPTKKK